MSRSAAFVLIAITLLPFPRRVSAQSDAPPNTGQAPPQVTLPPATKLEAFQPAAGTVVTLAYDDIGVIGPGFSTPGLVSVDVRQLRGSNGDPVNGMVVEVVESQYRKEIAFIDVDEIPELIRGIDALLDVKANPTQFKNFELRYTTRGDLRFTCYNNAKGIAYSARAGRVTTATRFNLSAGDMQKLRGMFESGLHKLNSIASK